MIKPLADTKEAEHPTDKRADACITWSIQLWLGSKPYWLFNCAIGKLSKVHMPSLANTE